jgi:methionine aminotransferase
MQKTLRNSVCETSRSLMQNLHSKLPDVGTTIFTVMSQLAQKHSAINLSQGFPDFPAPSELLEGINHHLHNGHNQYAPMAGIPELREQIAAKTLAVYQHTANPDTEITVTSGATSALFCAIEAFVHTGDEVIVFDPAYDSYDPAIRLAGGSAVHIPLTAPDFCIDWGQVASAINQRTRMIILNSPHNPTGAVLSAKDIASLTTLIRDTNIILLSDEVYEHMVFDNQRHESLLHHAELAARSLVISSFGKTYHATGWKVGYCIAPAELMTEFRRIHQYIQFCVVTPIQYALAEYLQTHPEHYQQLPDFYEEKRNKFNDLLSSSRLKLKPSAGTYFQLADYGAISNKADTEFTRWMTVEKGIAAIPISVFYAAENQPDKQTLMRFCFAKNDQTLEQAAEILCAI